MQLTLILLLLLFVASPLRAGILQSDAPFSFSGTGYFYSEGPPYAENPFSGQPYKNSVEGYGNNGVDSIMFSGYGSDAGWAGTSPSFSGDGPRMDVNGYEVFLDYYLIGAGPDSKITFYDPLDNRLVTIQFTSYTHRTSINHFPPDEFSSDWYYRGTFDFNSTAPIPEPSTIALTLAAFVGLALRARRARRRTSSP